MESLDIYSIKSENEGPNFLVFGAIHGNEWPGTVAINAIRALFDLNTISLVKGSVTFVPVANPLAFERRERFIQEDLNRIFKDSQKPLTYEARLANSLGLLIKNTDIFLDIHTTSAPGPTCVFIDFPTHDNIEFANALGMEYSLSGWPKLYATNPRGLDSFDTTRYAYEHGKIGIIIECGQHEEPQAVSIAERSILRALVHFKMIDSKKTSEISVAKTKSILLQQLEYKDQDADTFTREWKHLESIPKNTVVAIRASGEKITTAHDSIMLLPKHSAKAGQEWFYLGLEE